MIKFLWWKKAFYFQPTRWVECDFKKKTKSVLRTVGIYRFFPTIWGWKKNGIKEQRLSKLLKATAGNGRLKVFFALLGDAKKPGGGGACQAARPGSPAREEPIRRHCRQGGREGKGKRRSLRGGGGGGGGSSSVNNTIGLLYRRLACQEGDYKDKGPLPPERQRKEGGSRRHVAGP